MFELTDTYCDKGTYFKMKALSRTLFNEHLINCMILFIRKAENFEYTLKEMNNVKLVPKVPFQNVKLV